MTTATLHVKRAAKGYADSLRAYELIVNGEKRAELRPGEEKTIEVDSGQADIYMRLDSGRSRSVVLSLAPGAEVSLFCQPRSALTALYRVTLGRNNYMRLEVLGVSGGEADRR